MSYGSDDAGRSVRRVMATILPFPWAMSLERDPIMDVDRPAGVVEAGEGNVSDYRTTVPQGAYTRTVPITITLYPSLPPGDGGAREAGRTARRLADALERLFTHGPSGGDGPGMGETGFVFATGRPASGPMTLPLWDWDEVPLEGEPEERRGPAFPISTMRIESLSSNAIQDDQEARRWTVAVEMRLSWRVPGRVGPERPLVESMPGTFEP